MTVDTTEGEYTYKLNAPVNIFDMDFELVDYNNVAQVKTDKDDFALTMIVEKSKF